MTLIMIDGVIIGPVSMVLRGRFFEPGQEPCNEPIKPEVEGDSDDYWHFDQ